MFNWRDLLGYSEGFRRNFTLLATSNVASQIIGLAVLPLLSRAFKPADFGAFAFFSSLYSIVLSFSALRLDWLIPRAKTNRAAAHLQTAGLLGVIGVTILSLVVLLICIDKLSANIQFVMAWVPISILFGGSFLVLQSGCVWSGIMSKVGLARLVQAVSVAIVSLMLGFFFELDGGLIIGYVCGLAVAFAFVASQGEHVLSANIKKASTAFRKVARRRRQEISTHILLAVINVLLTNSPILLLHLFFSPDEVGAYSIAYRVAVAPVGIICGAIAYSFVSEAAGMIRDRSPKLRSFYKHTIYRLAVLSAFAVFAAIIASFFLPAILGGKEWIKASYYLMAVAPYLVGVIVFSPTTHLFLYGRSAIQASLDALTLIGVVLAFTVGKVIWNSPVAAVSIASVIFLLGYIVRHFAHLAAITKQEVCVEYA